MKTSIEQSRYAAMGMASMLPGLQFAVETLQAKLDEMRAILAHVQENGAAPESKPRSESPHGGESWASMTPGERSVEMKRRMAVARGRAESRQGSRRPVGDPALSSRRQKEWAAMSPRKRKERLAKMEAGRRAARKKPEAEAVA